MPFPITSTLAAFCACLFGLLLLSGGNAGLALALVWTVFIGFFVAVIEAGLTLTGAIKFFSGPSR